MIKSSTVKALMRAHEREKEQLLAIIREQNDRLMLLAGKPWTLPPRPVVEPLPVEDDGWEPV